MNRNQKKEIRKALESSRALTPKQIEMVVIATTQMPESSARSFINNIKENPEEVINYIRIPKQRN